VTVSGIAPLPVGVWYAPFTVIIFPLVSAWVVAIGAGILLDRVGRARFDVTVGDDRWIDVSDDAERFRSRTRRVRTGRILALTGRVSCSGRLRCSSRSCRHRPSWWWRLSASSSPAGPG
jgi:hypothetical protein